MVDGRTGLTVKTVATDRARNQPVVIVQVLDDGLDRAGYAYAP